MRIYLAALFNGPDPIYKFKKYANARKRIEERKNFILCSFIEGARNCDKSLRIAGDTEHFLLDSGAFSYMNGKQVSKREMEHYLSEYINYINSRNVKHFFEMDVDVIFGLEHVERMRARLERETGKQCIPVWHLNRGIEYWKKMVAEYPYVAIGGLVSKDGGLSADKFFAICRKLNDYAKRRGVKVHVLGCTNTTVIKDMGFYSADSTSWKMSGIRSAKKAIFENGEIRHEDIITTKKINYKNLLCHNMLEWLKYQDYMLTEGDVL